MKSTTSTHELREALEARGYAVIAKSELERFRGQAEGRLAEAPDETFLSVFHLQFDRAMKAGLVEPTERDSWSAAFQRQPLDAMAMLGYDWSRLA